MNAESNTTTRPRLARAATEFLLISTGVLVALAAQAWWESQAEDALAAQHIENLLVELRDNQRGLMEAGERHQRNAERAARVLALMGRSENPAVVDSLELAAASLLFYEVFVPGTAALDNLLGGGGLGLLDDPAVRLELARYSQSLGMFDSYSDDLISFQTNRVRPALDRVVSLRTDGFLRMMARREVEVPPNGRTFDPGALRTLEFENLVAGRVGQETDMVRQSQALMEQSAALIRTLEALN
jgi:hypothetical protein